ncbi:MAG TPA: ABC transporter permease [Anaeromyxobacteraceae bacterium]|nr:ABC transporter permease [Anaeromyxobacteraceae bacterium]
MTGFVDDVGMALGTLRGAKLRAALTLLGIVIGACTVVAMMALTEGLRLKVNGDFAVLGANSFQVQRWPVGFGDVDWQKYAKRRSLTRAQGEALHGLPHVRHVSVEARHDGGERLWTRERATRPTLTVVGGTPEYEHANGVTVARGRFLSDVDMALGRRVVFLGADVADALFPGQDPVGQEVRLRQAPFTVVGVAERQGSILGMESRDTFAVIPIEAHEEVTGRSRDHTFTVEATSAEDLARAIDEVVFQLRKVRHVRGLEENDFEYFTNDTFAKTVNELASVVAAATFGVCALALLVGGIGIMNIMLVSVTERTREIGIRMALGARRRRILGQFVIEAVTLSLLGGLIGVALGAAVALGARELLAVPASVPVWAVALSLASACGCGLLFGIYPASRASRLDPVEAMRAE